MNNPILFEQAKNQPIFVCLLKHIKNKENIRSNILKNRLVDYLNNQNSYFKIHNDLFEKYRDVEITKENLDGCIYDHQIFMTATHNLFISIFSLLDQYIKYIVDEYFLEEYTIFNSKNKGARDIKFTHKRFFSFLENLKLNQEHLNTKFVRFYNSLEEYIKIIWIVSESIRDDILIHADNADPMFVKRSPIYNRGTIYHKCIFDNFNKKILKPSRLVKKVFEFNPILVAEEMNIIGISTIGFNSLLHEFILYCDLVLTSMQNQDKSICN